MGGPGQLFTYKELKSRTAKQGETLKRRARNIIGAESSQNIARVIIVVRSGKARGAKKRKSKSKSKRY